MMENLTKSDEREVTAKILIVDDEKSTCDLLKKVFQMEGDYEVKTAFDGLEAQRMIEKEYFNVVITDLKMPHLCGLSLMQWAQELHPGMAWIILSGQATVDNAIEAVHLGAFDFVQKPIRMLSNITVTVRNAIEQQRLTEAQVKLTQSLTEKNSQLAIRVNELCMAYDVLADQAEMIGQDLHRAELIQRAMLPYEPPAMNRVVANTIYRPCHNVGGDLYEIIRPDEKHLVFYIADAAGHGVSAAMLAVLFKHRIGVLDEKRHVRQPAEVLESANKALLTECDAPGLFLTAAFCLLDMEAGELTVASAGHPPLLLLRADGTRERIYHTGPALGLNRDAHFAQKKIRFKTGDRILLYTDGVFEALDTDKALTSDDLEDMLARRDLQGQMLLDGLLEMVAERSGQDHQEDDITMVMLTAGEGGQSFLDNGTPEPMPISQNSKSSLRAQVLTGQSGDQTFLCIEGRANWTFCAAFHEECFTHIKQHEDIILDLSLCTQLDSTFYGTIYELASQAGENDTAFTIQGVLPGIQQQFEELGMEKVLDHIVADMQPLPNQMEQMGTTPAGEWRDHRRMLHAHEALASLNQKNWQEFSLLLKGLRQESKRMEQMKHEEEALKI